MTDNGYPLDVNELALVIVADYEKVMNVAPSASQLREIKALAKSIHAAQLAKAEKAGRRFMLARIGGRGSCIAMSYGGMYSTAYKAVQENSGAYEIYELIPTEDE